MAEKKKTPFKKAKPAAKTPVIILSDQEKVESVFDDVSCVAIKDGFVVFDMAGEKAKSLHSGIAKSESDAWKLAAHNL